VKAVTAISKLETSLRWKNDTSSRLTRKCRSSPSAAKVSGFITAEGERYLDLYGGHAVAGTGHCHPHVVKAIREQTEKLLFYSNLVYSETRARAAEKLGLSRA
jgi:acetylornithine/succinyldiaminopimelate/putrescine aminotransferase